MPSCEARTVKCAYFRSSGGCRNKYGGTYIHALALDWHLISFIGVENGNVNMLENEVLFKFIFMLYELYDRDSPVENIVIY